MKFAAVEENKPTSSDKLEQITWGIEVRLLRLSTVCGCVRASGLTPKPQHALPSRLLKDRVYLDLGACHYVFQAPPVTISSNGVEWEGERERRALPCTHSLMCYYHVSLCLSLSLPPPSHPSCPLSFTLLFSPTFCIPSIFYFFFIFHHCPPFAFTPLSCSHTVSPNFLLSCLSLSLICLSLSINLTF